MLPDYTGALVGENLSGTHYQSPFPPDTFSGTFNGSELNLTMAFSMPASDGYNSFSTIEATVVPLPSTMILFMGGAAFLRRRRIVS